MIIKTDRKDARGMAHLLRTGWFRPVHVKSVSEFSPYETGRSPG